MSKKLFTGERKTKQKTAIYNVILSAKGPMSVEHIHEATKKSLPKIGIATIYRNIKQLLEAGSIVQLTLPKGEVVYESASLAHHHHFHCQSCDKVFDIHSCPLSKKDIEKVLPIGFSASFHSITLEGICSTCNK